MWYTCLNSRPAQATQLVNLSFSLCPSIYLPPFFHSLLSKKVLIFLPLSRFSSGFTWRRPLLSSYLFHLLPSQAPSCPFSLAPAPEPSGGSAQSTQHTVLLSVSLAFLLRMISKLWKGVKGLDAVFQLSSESMVMLLPWGVLPSLCIALCVLASLRVPPSPRCPIPKSLLILWKVLDWFCVSFVRRDTLTNVTF